VLAGQFFPTPAPALGRTRSLRAVLAKRENDPRFAGHLAEARKHLAREAFPEEGKRSLQGLRLAAGLSQTQVAEKIGTAQSHIALIEQGKNDPGTDLITRIADALGVESEVVFGAVRAARNERKKQS
jgi:DNA-binding XRE family transcriptional regulator